MQLDQICNTLHSAAKKLASLQTHEKHAALQTVAEALQTKKNHILHANECDVKKAQLQGMRESLIDRLTLTESRIEQIVQSIQCIINQPDPIGRILEGWKTEEGLEIRKVCVPFGVAAVIYESRPNVTVDAFALAYKSGNAVLLRGSSSAAESNRALVNIIQSALAPYGTADSLALTDSSSRDDVDWILQAVGKIDILLPRGGAELIKHVVENARVPVIETGSGVCHLYVDEYADLAMAAQIAQNAKMQRPGVCNAIETILVHEKVVAEFLLKLIPIFESKVKMYCCEKTFPLVQKMKKNAALAQPNHFGFEFLDFEIAIKQVATLEQAIHHINTHNTKHSETIITANYHHAKKFQAEIDAACVYVNASTRFTDGGTFGFGAELGISTQKLHVRGPMGLQALTTTKYLIDGNGQIR